MECVSTWPLLQRNKIEDSKINVAVQAIADAPIPEDEGTAADIPVKPDEEISKPQEVKVEPPGPVNMGSTVLSVDQTMTVVKPENAEPADAPMSTEPTSDVTPMTVDEPNLEPERRRASEKHESQAVKLKRLAIKVLIPEPMPSRC